MTKLLDLLGLAFVGIMALGFMGLLQPTIQPGLSPLFWICAGGAMIIIMYRKIKKKREDESHQADVQDAGSDSGNTSGTSRGSHKRRR